MYISNFKVFAHYHTCVVRIPQNYVTRLLRGKKSRNFVIFDHGKPGKIRKFY